MLTFPDVLSRDIPPDDLGIAMGDSDYWRSVIRCLSPSVPNDDGNYYHYYYYYYYYHYHYFYVRFI